MVRLTTFLKAKIIVLWEQNQSIKKIARDMNITVSKIMNGTSNSRYIYVLFSKLLILVFCCFSKVFLIGVNIYLLEKNRSEVDKKISGDG